MIVLDPAIARALKDAAGPDGWSESASEIAPHLVELRGRWKGETPLLLRPASTEAVSRILAPPAGPGRLLEAPHRCFIEPAHGAVPRGAAARRRRSLMASPSP